MKISDAPQPACDVCKNNRRLTRIKFKRWLVSGKTPGRPQIKGKLMKPPWIFLFVMLLGIASCSRPDDTPPKTPEKEAAIPRPEVLSMEKKVLMVANAVSSAAENKDIKGIMAAMAKDVRISATAAAASSPREYTYGTYEAYLTSAFPLISAYRYKRSNESIKALGDDIVFSFLVNETYELQGKPATETHQETWHLRDGPAGLQIHKILISQ